MACCAFAVFLLLNLLAPIGWLRRSNQGRRRTNAAVAWRYGEPGVATVATPSPRRWRRTMAGVAAVELLALLALSTYWLAPFAASEGAAAVEDWDALIALHTSWCGSEVPGTTSEFNLTER